MKKTHQNFFNKLNQFSDKPVVIWNHYDLLGYFCRQTGMTIQLIDNESPSRHPQVQLMQRLIAQTKNIKLFLLPSHYESRDVKRFLDYWLPFIMKKKTITSVGYLTNNEKYFKIWHKIAKFDSPQLPDEVIFEITEIMLEAA